MARGSSYIDSGCGSEAMGSDSSRVVGGSNELTGVSTQLLILGEARGLQMLQLASLRKLEVRVPSLEGPRRTWRDREDLNQTGQKST